MLINQLPERGTATSPTGCCPEFKPSDWDGQTFRFEDKLFMKVTTHSFLHVPLNMDAVMKDAMQAIDDAKARTTDQHIMLSDDSSPWQGVHYLSVDKNVPGAEMVSLSGMYLTKVFEGPFKNAGMWLKQLVAYARARGHEPIKCYFNYTTCPKCAEYYGKNYVVGFAQIE